MAELVRLNKYIADRGIATRRAADVLIAGGRVLVNGKRARIGQKVSEEDSVVVKSDQKSYRYFAFHKPRGVITHSPRRFEKDIRDIIPLEGVFPIGRLDKHSSGLIILTDDGRVTERLLSPRFDHEKEYVVKVAQPLRPSFAEHMQKGVDIGEYVTKKCKVKVLGERTFSIVLSEGKKHQIRRMCSALHTDVVELRRIRVMNIKLEKLEPGMYRPIEGSELSTFLSSLGLNHQN